MIDLILKNIKFRSAPGSCPYAAYENKHVHHLKLSWNVLQGLFYSHDKLATLQGGQPWKKCLAEMWSKDKPQEQVCDIY